MKKQSGFTLIELMVVMAIIAILATAGLAAYTGYIKKARDTTRIADLAAINTIAISALSTNGTPPVLADLVTAITNSNNGVLLTDPIGSASVCFGENGFEYACGSSASPGHYLYALCDNGSGFVVATGFESSSNASLMTTDIQGGTGYSNNYYYNLGNCISQDEEYGAII